ncbi:hypothetical protein DY000_02024433 [Brassica cretica]|uniref:Uncharacterized protein n=1 Tax=Brassica cretica TaxID=69181 RepID=A0ABQ7E6V4_BRACR|nr:hypothetical protein DY000_02024433 [Brassica cretica]
MTNCAYKKMTDCAYHESSSDRVELDGASPFSDPAVPCRCGASMAVSVKLEDGFTSACLYSVLLWGL